MARIIEFFDGADSDLAPVIGNIVASNMTTYPDDASYEAGEAGSPAEGNVYFNTTDKTVRYYDGTQWIEIGRQIDIQANADDIADIRTTTGTADGDTDMGVYSGGLINDNESTKQNIQQVETQVETNETDIAAAEQEATDIRASLGTSNGDTDMGTYTGSILTDNSDQVSLNQEISDAIEAIPSGLAFQGNWDADTNTPTLVSSTGLAGYYYNVSVAGSTSLDGESDWEVGDWAVFSDTGVWQKIDNSETVTSVNGETGAVVLTTTNIAEGTNEYYTNAKAEARIAAASVDDLSDVDTTTSVPALNNVLEWDGSDWVPGSGSADFSTTEESGNYSAVIKDFVLCDSSGGPFTVTLPVAASSQGKMIGVKKTDSSTNEVTIDGNASETIDGSLTYTVGAQNYSVVLMSDGANWQVISDSVVHKTQTKYLTADVTSDGPMSDITFSNLTIGKWYEVIGQAKMQLDTGVSDSAVRIQYFHNGSIIGVSEIIINEAGDTSVDGLTITIVLRFKATATTFVPTANSAGSGAAILGNSTDEETWMTISEANLMQSTSEY